MAESHPNLILLAGPNGAGKTTAAQVVLRGTLEVYDFVNADLIAQGISPFRPESAAIAAGRIMLARLRELTAQRSDVAFESTLASRTFAPWIRDLKKSGYEFHLFFFWLSSPEMAIDRVEARTRKGGHYIPEPDVRRRYAAGLENFFRIYMPMADSWKFFDNRSRPGRMVAKGSGDRIEAVHDCALWETIKRDWS